MTNNELDLQAILQPLIDAGDIKSAGEIFYGANIADNLSQEFKDWYNSAWNSDRSKEARARRQPPVDSDVSKVVASDSKQDLDVGVITINGEKQYLKSAILEIDSKIQENRENLARLPEKIAQARDSLRDSPIDEREFRLMDLQQALYGGEYYNKENERLANDKKQPYFGRIDFVNNLHRRKIYLSKNRSLSDLYINWRAPIAELYYRYPKPIKNVSYDTPRGKITGDILLKARHDIKNGVLKNFEADTLSGNYREKDEPVDLLQSVLSRGSTPKMREIVETIQEEQDAAIRHDPREDVIIQGVAGSGKTSVALHRIAYLMYGDNGKNGLKSHEVLMISPSTEFSEYIANVLPELGEAEVQTKTFDAIILESIGYQSEDIATFVERFYRDEDPDSAISSHFSKEASRKVEKIARAIVKHREQLAALNLEREKILSEIEECLNEIQEHNKNLRRLREDRNKAKQYAALVENFEDGVTSSLWQSKEAKLNRIYKKASSAYGELSKGAADSVKKQIRESITNGVSLKPNEIYVLKEDVLPEIKKLIDSIPDKELELSKLVSRENRLRERASRLVDRALEYTYIDIDDRDIFVLANSIEDYWQAEFKTRLEPHSYSTDPYFIYLTLAMRGEIIYRNKHTERNYYDSKGRIRKIPEKIIKESDIKHIVVDEAQDYTSFHFKILKTLCPHATITVLGDKNQNVNPYFRHNSLESLIAGAKYFHISKAYRSSPEIVDYCNRILGLTGVIPIRKSQNIPVFEEIVDHTHPLTSGRIKLDIENKCRKNGAKRIGVIVRDNKQLETLNGANFGEDVSVLPVYKAKGLEFDAALVLANYKDIEDELLYVACTRAQHVLVVYKK